MERKRRQAPADEPAVTFEIEGPQRGPARERLGATGAAAAASVGLVSGGASPATSGSLDVFDDVPGGTGGDVPVTSFAELAAPVLPPIDFSSPDTPEPEAAGFGSDSTHGAIPSVGGGFTFDSPSSEIALSAPDPDIKPVDMSSDELLADAEDLDLDELD